MGFIVLGLVFKNLLYFEFIFMDVKNANFYFFLYVAIRFPQQNWEVPHIQVSRFPQIWKNYLPLLFIPYTSIEYH